MMPIFSLSGGLFAGWAFGANDTSGVIAPAVGSRMLSFRTTARFCTLALLLGALASGTSPSQTLASLGHVNTPSHAWAIALGAGASVVLMTRFRMPVSTVQAMAGALLGWTVYSGAPIAVRPLLTLLLVWMVCPLLSALLAVCLYKFVAALITRLHINMFKLDRMIRMALFLACGFSAYALGANNVAGVAGVFLPLSPFTDLTLSGAVHVTAAQQLYGAVGLMAIPGLFTGGRALAGATGEGIFKFSAAPLMALVAVLTHGLVLLLFTSHGLSAFVARYGVPALPLVPLSGCQILVGATMGLTLLKSGLTVPWRSLAGTTLCWGLTPILASLLTCTVLVALRFFL